MLKQWKETLARLAREKVEAFIRFRARRLLSVRTFAYSLSNMEREEVLVEIKNEIQRETNRLLRWILGMVIGGVLSITAGLIAWGELRSDVNTLKKDAKSADYFYTNFITRIEYLEMLKTRDKSLEETKAAVLRIENKLDVLVR